MYFCTASVWQHRTSRKDFQPAGQTGVSQSLSQNMSLHGFRKEKTALKKKKGSRQDSEKNSTHKSSSQVKFVFTIVEMSMLLTNNSPQ